MLYPSKAQLEAGAEEPAKIGDYILHKSEHETGRVFSRIKDLGVDGGVSVGEQVQSDGLFFLCSSFYLFIYLFIYFQFFCFFFPPVLFFSFLFFSYFGLRRLNCFL